jgi:hypothetical protein
MLVLGIFLFYRPHFFPTLDREFTQHATRNTPRIMPVSTHTIGVLARAAAEKIGQFPLADRIKIYQALGESLPDDAARVGAFDLARILSQAAAMELEFQEQIRTQANGE